MVEVCVVVSSMTDEMFVDLQGFAQRWNVLPENIHVRDAPDLRHHLHRGYMIRTYNGNDEEKSRENVDDIDAPNGIEVRSVHSIPET